MIVKDGYTLTIGGIVWTLTDEATGEVIAEIDMDAGRGGNVLVEAPTGTGRWTFTDATTGDVLLVITEDDIVAAEHAAMEAVEVPTTEVFEEPTELLAFSVDGQTWTVGAVWDLFGDDASLLRTAVGADRAVALILTDFEAIMEYAHGERATPPRMEVWIGEPGE
jgi:hypothetical protein